MKKDDYKTTSLAYYDGKTFKWDSRDSEAQQRFFKSKETLKKYSIVILESENDEIAQAQIGRYRIRFWDDRSCCSCPDMQKREKLCKHILAIGSHLSGQEAFIPRPERCDRPTGGRKSLRPQDIRVGRYFMLSDFLFSDTAAKEGISNWVDWGSDYGKGVLIAMEALCNGLLDPLCNEFKRLTITRGYLGKELFKRLWPKYEENWIEGALAHGYQETGGADILVHGWDGSALDLALHIQKDCKYLFDFIRVYPNSPVLCVGVGLFVNKREIQEWRTGFKGVTLHKLPK